MPIPNVFGAYNRKLACGDSEAAHLQHLVDVLGKGKAKDCVACEQVCPQHVDIVANTRIIARKLDALPSLFDD